MDVIYVGQEIDINWSIRRNASEVLEDFSKADLKVFLTGNDFDGNYDGKYYFANIIDEQGRVKLVIEAGSLTPGTYCIEGIWIKNSHELLNSGWTRSISRARKDRIFKVSDVEEECTDYNEEEGHVVEASHEINIATGTTSYGYDGMSAYETAVFNGSTAKTEKEWIDTYEKAEDRVNYEMDPDNDGEEQGDHESWAHKVDSWHTRAESDHNTASSDHTRAENDHSTAASDHSTAANDHTQAGTDHTRAESDHNTASSDHTRAENDHSTAASDHSTASNDHTQAGTDHTRAESDHSTAANDHTRAENDHTQAANDHTRAGNDHITAATDHTQAGTDHTQAVEDHLITQGFNSRVVALENEVFPLEAALSIEDNVTLFEYTGTAVSKDVSWAVKRQGEVTTIDSMTLKQDSETIESGSSASGTETVSLNKLGVTAFVLNASKNMLSVSKTLNVEMVRKMYFGFADDDLADPTTLTAQTLKSSPAGTYTMSNGTAGKYLWLCVGSNKTISGVTSAGFEVPMEAAETIGNYKCYRSSEALAAGSITFTII